MRQEEEQQVITFFRDVITGYVDSKYSQEQWGRKRSDNEIMAMEIRNAMEVREESFHFLKKTVTDQGFEIRARIGPAIKSWSDLRHALYDIIAAVAETFMLIQCTVDETSLNYWLVTGSFAGSSAHGHIGTIRIEKEDVIPLNPEFFNRYKTTHSGVEKLET